MDGQVAQQHRDRAGGTLQLLPHRLAELGGETVRRPGDADRVGRAPALVANRSAQAPEIELRFLVVDRVAALADGPEIVEQLAERGPRPGRAGREGRLREQLASLLLGEAGEDRLPERGGMPGV